MPIAVWGIVGFSEIYYGTVWTILAAALTAYLKLLSENSLLSSILCKHSWPYRVMLCLLIMSVGVISDFGRYVSKTDRASSQPQHHHPEYSI